MAERGLCVDPHDGLAMDPDLCRRGAAPPAGERHLKGLDQRNFADRAGYYLGEINAVHPFRDGKGRAREFIRGSWEAVTTARPREARGMPLP